MRELVSGVYLMEGLLGANVYLLLSGNGLTLVDSGMAVDAGRILAQLSQAGYAPSDVNNIVLTHWHGDHTGGARMLATRTGAQVLAHREEAPYVEKTLPPPAATGRQRRLNWLGEHVILRRPSCDVDRLLEDGDRIEALDGTLIMHTAGHSPGSLCLYQPEREILFCGDAIFNRHPITQRRGLGLYMRFLTLDNERAYQVACRLATLPVQVLCCGHGEPILEGAGEQMRALFRDRSIATS